MQFVIAALVAAVFLIDRPADHEELRRRFFQVALAFCIVGFVVAVAIYAFPFEGVPISVLQPGSSGGDAVSQALRERYLLEAGAAIALTLAGLSSWQVTRTLSIAGVLAGALLFAISVFPESQSATGVLYDFTSQAGDERNLLFAVILGAGVLSLGLYGFNHWDSTSDGSDDDEATDDAAADLARWERK